MEVSFSTPQVQDTSSGLQIVLPEATSYTATTGEPVLPAVTRVFQLPFPIRINSVTVNFIGSCSTFVDKPLTVASPVTIDGTTISPATNEITETAVDMGPTYSYNSGAGRGSDSLTTFLSVKLFPVWYDETQQVVSCAVSATITVSYTLLPPHPAPTKAIDLVIVAPKKFAKALAPLVEHKLSKGCQTLLVTMDQVCNGTYFPKQGRDCAEELKYFIKGAVDAWDTWYVLLVGGRAGGIDNETWYVPVRYPALDDLSGSEYSYLSDLYFADLYNATGDFQTWDTDNNGVFGQWNGQAKDILDMYPDVFVGRLPCTTVGQVETMVKKIITYETTTAGASWFKQFIGVGGDTYPVEGDPVFEGEMATNYSYNCIKSDGFNATMVWTSTGVFEDKQDVIEAMSQGAGFVHFSGHGNPATWATHKPYNNSFVDGPKSWEMNGLGNGVKLPVVIVGGCHNAQFNTSLWNMVKGVGEDGLRYFKWKAPFGRFWYNEWVPRCWAWSMAVQPNGGCIGIIANTGLGYGQQGAMSWNHSGRYLEWLFFKSYADGQHVLGKTHAYELEYYMADWPPMEDRIDCKIVQEWCLLGDPSLMIGGYSG